MIFLSPDPHFVINITSRWRTRMGQTCILQGCSPSPLLRSCDLVINAISITSRQRVGLGGNARQSITNVRSRGSGEATLMTQLALALLNLIRGQRASTGCAKLWEGGKGFRVLRKLRLGRLFRDIVRLGHFHPNVRKLLICDLRPGPNSISRLREFCIASPMHRIQ